MSSHWSNQKLFSAADLGLAAIAFETLYPGRRFYADPDRLSVVFEKLEEPVAARSDVLPYSLLHCHECGEFADYNAWTADGFAHFCPHDIVFYMEEDR